MPDNYIEKLMERSAADRRFGQQVLAEMMGKTIAGVDAKCSFGHDVDQIVIRFTDGSVFKAKSSPAGYGGETEIEYVLKRPDGEYMKNPYYDVAARA